MIIKLLCVFVGSSTVDIWWWPFLMVRCSLYGQCRFTMMAMTCKRLSFKYPMVCCDLYEEIKMAVFYIYVGDCGSTVVKVLCSKSEGRWFDPSWCQWIFHRH